MNSATRSTIGMWPHSSIRQISALSALGPYPDRLRIDYLILFPGDDEKGIFMILACLASLPREISRFEMLKVLETAAGVDRPASSTITS